MANDDPGAAGEERTLGSEAPFDFAQHRQSAVDQYAEVRELYDECAQAVRAVLKVALQVEQISIHSVDARGKSVDSFGEKTERQDDNDANKPKYPYPLKEITDLAGVRVIVFLHDQIDEVCKLVEREFDVITREDIQQDSGYRGLHLLANFDARRLRLPEYRRYANRTTEVQIRTVLQHAWSEIEHGIAYKPATPVPDAIQSQLRDLAGALGLADRGLQTVASQTEKERFSGREQRGR